MPVFPVLRGWRWGIKSSRLPSATREFKVSLGYTRQEVRRERERERDLVIMGPVF